MSLFPNINPFRRRSDADDPLQSTEIDQNWLQQRREELSERRRQEQEEQARRDELRRQQHQIEMDLMRRRRERQGGRRAQQQREAALQDLFSSRDRQAQNWEPLESGFSPVRGEATTTPEEIRADVFRVANTTSGTIQTPSHRRYTFDFSRINSVDDLGKVLETVCESMNLNMTEEALEKHGISHLVKRVDDMEGSR